MESAPARLDFTPRAWQYQAACGMRGVLNALLICSRQVGKTWLALNILALRCLSGPPNHNCCYAAPAQSQARRIAWPILKQQLQPIWHLCTFSETQLKATFPGNRCIYLLGCENENARGSSFRTILCDERDNISDQLWREVMLPTTNDWGDEAFILYIGTLAGGTSTLWNMYVRERDNPNWFCMVVPASTSGLFTPEYLARKRMDLGESAFRREMECDPAAPVENSVVGEAINNAQREGRIYRIPYESGREVWTCWDLGIRDFTTVWGFTLEGRNVVWHFYREWQGVDMANCMARLRAEFPRMTWGEAVLPHDAKKRSGVTSMYSVKDLFFDRWPGHVYHYESAPSPVDTLSSLRLVLDASEFNDAGCETGILRLKSARYVMQPKTGTVTDSILHDDNSHCLDAARYGAHRIKSLYPEQRYSGYNEKIEVVG